MMRFRLIYFFITALLVSSCVKEITELPPATQSGANTFGCKIDGAFWVPAGFGIIPTAPKLEARMLPDNTLIINARNFSRSPTETEFEFIIKNVTAPGEYLLNVNTGHPNLGASYAYYVRRRLTPLNEWITTSQFSGKVTITKTEMSSNGITSGLFEFYAKGLIDTSQVIHITEGRFDLRLL